MPKQILIHIGTGKTGSTAIQEQLADDTAKLEALGVSYLRMFKQKDHQELIALYRPFEELPRGLKSKYLRKPDFNFDKMRKRYKQEFCKFLNASDKVVLSTEYFSSMKINEILLLKKDLKAAGFFDVKVLVYIREPVSYYISFVQQQLKASCKFADPVNFKYGFVSTIECWNVAFPNAIEVRQFGYKYLLNGCIIKDFFKVASEYFLLNLSVEDMLERKPNQSVSAEGMMILQKYRAMFYTDYENIFFKDSNLLAKILESTKTDIKQTKPVVKEVVRRIILQNHMADLQYLKAQYGLEYEIPLIDENNFISDRFLKSDAWSLEDILEHIDNVVVNQLLFAVLHRILLLVNKDKTNCKGSSRVSMDMAPLGGSPQEPSKDL